MSYKFRKLPSIIQTATLFSIGDNIVNSWRANYGEIKAVTTVLFRLNTALEVKKQKRARVCDGQAARGSIIISGGPALCVIAARCTTRKTAPVDRKLFIRISLRVRIFERGWGASFPKNAGTTNDDSIRLSYFDTLWPIH